MTKAEDTSGRNAPDGSAASSRPRRAAACVLAAWAPWLALAVGVTAIALWWTQRPWPMRLAACGAAVAWSLAWCWRALRSPLDTRFRTPLAAVAAAALLPGLQGTVFGLATVPVVISAWLASAGALLFAIAVVTGPLGRAKALAAAVSSVLALAALEAGARALGVGDTARESDSLELARRFNNLTPPRTAFVNRPRPLDEFPPATVEINSVGIRGPEIPTGKVDLLLLGDSFIEARQLPWEETLGPRLQAALRARASSARVVSHGMRGWSPLLEWNWYLKVGRRFRAERVLLFFFWNDLWPAGTEVQTFRAVLGPDGRPDHFDVLLDGDWVWYRHVRVVRLIEEVARLVQTRSVRWSVPSGPVRSPAGGAVLDEVSARRMAEESAGGPLLSPAQVASLLAEPSDRLAADLQDLVKTGFWPAMRPMTIWTPDQVDAAAAAERELAGFAQDVAADGGRLVIVYVPNPYQAGADECSVGRYLDRLDAGAVLPEDSGVQAWLRSVTAAHGIEFLDPTGAMRGRSAAGRAGGAPPLHLRADCHWSPAGHQFVADWLTDWYLSGRMPGA